MPSGEIWGGTGPAAGALIELIVFRVPSHVPKSDNPRTRSCSLLLLPSPFSSSEVEGRAQSVVEGRGRGRGTEAGSVGKRPSRLVLNPEAARIARADLGLGSSDDGEYHRSTAETAERIPPAATELRSNMLHRLFKHALDLQMLRPSELDPYDEVQSVVGLRVLIRSNDGGARQRGCSGLAAVCTAPTDCRFRSLQGRVRRSSMIPRALARGAAPGWAYNRENMGECRTDERPRPTTSHD
jgi:hypothetical protein